MLSEIAPDILLHYMLRWRAKHVICGENSKDHCTTKETKVNSSNVHFVTSRFLSVVRYYSTSCPLDTAATSACIPSSSSCSLSLRKLTCSFRSFLHLFLRISINAQTQQYVSLCFFAASQISSSFFSLDACVEIIIN